MPKSFRLIKKFLSKKIKKKCYEVKDLKLKSLMNIKVNFKQVGSDRLTNAISLLNNKDNFINNCDLLLINLSKLNLNLVKQINKKDIKNIIIISCHHKDFWNKIKYLSNYKLKIRKKFIDEKIKYFISVSVFQKISMHG